MLATLKGLVRRWSWVAGVELRRRTARFVPRSTMEESLRHARTLGIAPRTVIDVGVNTGTPGLYGVFDGARYLLVDPLAENEVFMRHLCARYPGSSYVVAAAGPERGETVIHVSPDYGGSSVYQSVGPERRVPVWTLDDLVAARSAPGPYLVKIDTQGFELDILRGGAKVLEQTELVVLEVNLLPSSGMPQLADVVAFMRERGFVMHDAFDFQYRPRDGVLGAMDVAFIPLARRMAQGTAFRTPSQRERNVARKLRHREEALRRIGA